MSTPNLASPNDMKLEFPLPPPPGSPSPPQRRSRAWIWATVAVGVVILGIVAAAQTAQTGGADSPAAAAASPSPFEHYQVTPTIPTPTPAPLTEVPSIYYFEEPEVIGLGVQEAKGAIREAIGNASAGDAPLVYLDEAIDHRLVFRVTKRETDAADPGTVLQVRNAPTGPATITIPTGAEPGERIRTVIALVVATRPIQFQGDSIYIDGTGSAMVTWMDSYFSIHQKTVSLPAWFGVPAGVENYNAQRSLGDSGTITCQLRWDDKRYAQSRSSGSYAICSVSA